jgi:hypothetical protein
MCKKKEQQLFCIYLNNFVSASINLNCREDLTALKGLAGYLRYRFNNKELIPQIKIPIFELGLPDATVFLALKDITNVTLVPSGKQFH